MPIRSRISPASTVPALLAVLSLIPWPSSPADASDGMRCQGRLVDAGDSAAEVRARCGEPDFTDRWEADEVPPNAVAPDVEVWVYNPGAGRLLSILRFRNGRLQSVDSDGYGFAVPGPRDCEPNRITPGMSKYRLLESCGEPMQRDAIILHRPLKHRPGSFFVTVRREKWLYNFGSSRLQREVTLENGVVTDVTTGERGFRESD